MLFYDALNITLFLSPPLLPPRLSRSFLFTVFFPASARAWRRSAGGAASNGGETAEDRGEAAPLQIFPPTRPRR